MWLEEIPSSVMSVDCEIMDAQLRESRRRVLELLAEGRTSEVFLAFCHTISGTEIRVGETESEDPSTISRARVEDYIEAFLQEKEEGCKRDYRINDSAVATGAIMVLRERHALYTGILAAPQLAEFSDTLGV